MAGPHGTIAIVNLLLVHFVTTDWVEVSVLQPNIKATTSSIAKKGLTAFYSKNPSIQKLYKEPEDYSEFHENPIGQASFGVNASHDIDFNEKMLAQIQAFTMKPQSRREEEQLDDEMQTLSVLTAPEQVPEMLQQVHRKLLIENPNSPTSKIEFLHGLRNKILHKIKRSMENVWGPESRQARTSKMGYPNLESALMSISFLIFAVFLIKLIEQLIHSLSGGNYGNGNAAIMQVVPSTASIVGRKRRDVEKTLVTARIITLMDDFPVILNCDFHENHKYEHRK